MPQYIVRVELHHTVDPRPDYQKLHMNMQTAGFARTLTFDSVERKLPEAEYAINFDGTSEQVLAKAEKIAVETRLVYSVLVTHALRWVQSNLPPAK